MEATSLTMYIGKASGQLMLVRRGNSVHELCYDAYLAVHSRHVPGRRR